MARDKAAAYQPLGFQVRISPYRRWNPLRARSLLEQVIDAMTAARAVSVSLCRVLVCGSAMGRTCVGVGQSSLTSANDARHVGL